MTLRQPGRLRIRHDVKSGGRPPRSPAASQLPLLGSNQDSPDPIPLRLSPPLLSVGGLDCAFTCATTRSSGSHPVSTPSPLGAWLGVASQRVRRLREHSRTSFPTW